MLQHLRKQLKVRGFELEGSELHNFLSRLNETNGGLGKTGSVCRTDCTILKFSRTAFLAKTLLGWKVSAKIIRSLM